MDNDDKSGKSIYIKSNEYNDFIGRISAMLVKRSLQSSQNFLVRSSMNQGDSYVEIWFRTRGCHYFLQGGCTMCNYGYGLEVSSDDMIEYVRQSLQTVNLNEKTQLLVSPSGSMLDDWEVPVKARVGILTLVAKQPILSYSCESQAKFISDERIMQLRDILGNKIVLIGIGLESANPWLLKYSINKDLPLDQFQKAIKVLKSYQILSDANVTLGAPFLTQLEAIEDTVNTVHWAFRQGVDSCFIFPINVKQGTLVQWLWEQDLYSPPSLWSLIEVLYRLGPELSSRIGIAWHKTYYQDSKTLQRKYLSSPTTCPMCHNEVIRLLDKFMATRDFAIIRELNKLGCSCKSQWHAGLNDQHNIPIKDRVANAYKLIGEKILGDNWWKNHGDNILREMYATPL